MNKQKRTNCEKQCTWKGGKRQKDNQKKSNKHTERLTDTQQTENLQ